jgi:[ribosomal protein S18]-alanine N-acetyltransferase
MKIEQCTIRRATADDFSSLRQLEVTAHRHPWADDVLRSMLNALAIRAWLVEDAVGAIVAFAFVQAVADEASLLNLVTAPAHQGIGLGRFLLNHVIDVLTQEGIAQSIFLEVRISNYNAMRLYDSCGFVEVGQRRGYYEAEDGKREDAMMMALPLQISYL